MSVTYCTIKSTHFGGVKGWDMADREYSGMRKVILLNEFALSSRRQMSAGFPAHSSGSWELE